MESVSIVPTDMSKKLASVRSVSKSAQNMLKMALVLSATNNTL
jgi:hypothetical protein